MGGSRPPESDSATPQQKPTALVRSYVLPISAIEPRSSAIGSWS